MTSSIINSIDNTFHNASKYIYGTITRDLEYLSKEYTEVNDIVHTNLCILEEQKIASVISYYIFKCAYDCKGMDSFLIPGIEKKVQKELKEYLLDDFLLSVNSYDYYSLRYDNNKLILKILVNASRLITSKYNDILPVLPPEFKRMSLESNFKDRHDKIMDILVLLVFKFNHFGKDYNLYLSSLGFIKLDNLLDTDFIKIHKFYSKKKCLKEQELIH